ncbi:MAG: hypothetical protein ACOYH0_05620 [Saccharofermentanales bacterium]|jgi:hypothetical protein
MSQMERLLDVVTSLRSLADSVESLANIIESGESTKEESEVKVREQLSLEDVRRVLAEKSQAGHTAKIRALLDQYGAKKLSEVNPEFYSNLLQAVEDFE